MSMSELFYSQLKGFMQAGKKPLPPKNKRERFISKVIAFLILLTGVILYLLLFKLDFLSAHIFWRTLVITIPLLAMVVKFYRGISISWLINGLLKYWLASAMLLLIFVVVFLMLLSIFIPALFVLFEYFSALFMIGLGVIVPLSLRQAAKAVLYNESHVRKAYTELGADKKMNYLFYHLGALTFVPFFFAGLLMLAHASGLAGWFHDEVLGW